MTIAFASEPNRRGPHLFLRTLDQRQMAMDSIHNRQQLKKIEAIAGVREKHWVGDGFYVSTIFSPHQLSAQKSSPFILMDHAAPKVFGPSKTARGVGVHPHRGFETVTFAYQGEIQHRDSYGGGGTILAGDVQWMTAASGVVHEEFHSKRFGLSGGVFEMVQLWVNLPAKFKMTEPRYQLLKAESFPVINMGPAKARLIAGKHLGKQGPAKTYSPITICDMLFSKTGPVEFELEEGTTTLVFMMVGEGKVQANRSMSAGDLVVFDRTSTGSINIEATVGSRLLILNGQPLDEPVVAHGPFVMNTRNEIVEAIRDYNDGKMGMLSPKVRQE